MNKIEWIKEYASLHEESMLFLGTDEGQERFEDAIIGIAYRFGTQPVVAYDMDKVIQVFKEDMPDETDALEYFEFNVIGAWMGDGTPIFIETVEITEPTHTEI